VSPDLRGGFSDGERRISAGVPSRLDGARSQAALLRGFTDLSD
jgi:hypothetical protein